MAIPSFFKQNKPRGYNYKPRYYDPVKEELELRRRAWEAERAASDDGHEGQGEGTSAKSTEGGSATGTGEKATQPYRSKIMRGDMRNYFPRRQDNVRKQTTIRLLVIIIIMVLVIYLYLRF
ncbi:MAG: hypothetical protein GX622_08320 [Bacteroidales bacterium]|nr:hypothetical protein [Bacteroidales bacterium]